MKSVLNNGTKMVCFITQRPVHLGTEISCCIQKSSGLADFSQRTFKLTGELQKCFQENRRPYFTECSEDEKGLQKPAFFADFFFFNYMNQLNKFLQSSRKKRSDLQWLLIFKRKQNFWKNHVAKGNPAVWDGERGRMSASLKHYWNVDGEGQHDKNQTIFSLPFKYAWLKDSFFLWLVCSSVNK